MEGTKMGDNFQEMLKLPLRLGGSGPLMLKTVYSPRQQTLLFVTN